MMIFEADTIVVSGYVNRESYAAIKNQRFKYAGAECYQVSTTTNLIKS
jgi:hypothetical protein